jgi:hypothetical protein
VAGAGGGCITVRSVLLQATAADMQITAAANRALDVMVVSLGARPPAASARRMRTDSRQEISRKTPSLITGEAKKLGAIDVADRAGGDVRPSITRHTAKVRQTKAVAGRGRNWSADAEPLSRSVHA